MKENRFIEDGAGLEIQTATVKSAGYINRLSNITKRADAILKEGAPAGDGPTVSDVHVPTADMKAGPAPKKKPKAKTA